MVAAASVLGGGEGGGGRAAAVSVLQLACRVPCSDRQGLYMAKPHQPSIQVGRTVDTQLAAMSGQRLASFGCGDEDSGKLQEQFQSWAQGLLDAQTHQTNAAAVVEELEPIIEQVSQW